LLRHGVLLGFGAPSQLRLLAGQEHGRTIPLSDVEGLVCRSAADFWSVLSFAWQQHRRDRQHPTWILAGAGREPGCTVRQSL
jgi:hypothetical protein